MIPSGAVVDSAGQSYSGTNSYDFITAAAATPPPADNVLVGVTSTQGMSTATLKMYMPEVSSTSLITQSKLGNISVLSSTNINGTNITKLLPSPTDQISGLINDTGMSLTLKAPVNVGLQMLSLAGQSDVTTAKSFISNLINQALPDGQLTSAGASYKSSLLGALNTVVLKNSASQIAQTKVFNFTGNNSNQPISVQENNAQADLAVLNLNGLQNPSNVEINQVANAMVVGAGSVKTTSINPVNLFGDQTNQTLIGGVGNDFISGGGGSDILTGGGGIDTFLLGSPGFEKITDFNPNDVLKFNMFGVNNLNDLVKAITNVVDTPNSVIVTFFGSLQVELVGFHSNTNFPASMFQFS